MDEDRPHLHVVKSDAADDATIAAYNALDMGAPPDDFPDDGSLPEWGSLEFHQWLDGKQPPQAEKVAWKMWMRGRQVRRIASGDESARGGRKRTKPLTEEEVREAAVEMAAEELLAAAKLAAPFREKAILVLGKNLDSPDENVAHRAAVKLLEITDGKPTQTVVERQDGPKIIEYRTSALLPDLPVFVPGAGLESPGDAAALELDD